MEKKLGQEAAFPASDTVAQNRRYEPLQTGMSKRFYAACCAMQGFITANAEYTHGNVPIPSLSIIAGLSFDFADALLLKENENNS